jgi:hypothetical protein
METSCVIRVLVTGVIQKRPGQFEEVMRVLEFGAFADHRGGGGGSGEGWNRYTRLEFWKGLYHILRAVRRGAETFGLLISQVLCAVCCCCCCCCCCYFLRLFTQRLKQLANKPLANSYIWQVERASF